MLPYDSPSRCCGCGACVSFCPTSALTLQEDADGFLYPVCDERLCMRCGLCRDICGMARPVEHEPLAVYAATEKDTSQLKQSTSGGMFAALATLVLNDSGLVFGAALDEQLEPIHRSVSSPEELPLLQGSKYVQSAIGDTYDEARSALDKGQVVLFSGTPCQIAGLYGFLRGKSYGNLVTMDLICHGVPHAKFFRDYRAFLAQQAGAKVVDFKFRDKSTGWGLRGKVSYQSPDGTVWDEVLLGDQCSYYDLFLHGEFYRESCFACPYACRHRPADITVGDFWGIEELHPDWMTSQGGPFDPRQGISSLTVNSATGAAWVEKLKPHLIWKESTFEDAARRNKQLTESPVRSPWQEEVRALYQNGGYAALDRFALDRLAAEGSLTP